MDPEWLEALRRKSGLALSREGVWLYHGRPVDNPRVQAMFHRGVAVRADGEVTLSVGRMWAYVESDGPVFFVRAVAGLDSPEPTVRLLGERVLPLVPRAEGAAATVAGWGPDERLYLWIDGLAGPAICLREAHQALIGRIEERDGGHALDLGSGDATDDRRIGLVLLEAIPAADAGRPVLGGNPGATSPRA